MKTARSAAECPIYQTHFELGVSMGLFLIFKTSLTAGGWLFNQILLVILGHFFVNFIKADNSYLGAITEKLLDEIVLPLKT